MILLEKEVSVYRLAHFFLLYGLGILVVQSHLPNSPTDRAAIELFFFAHNSGP